MAQNPPKLTVAQLVKKFNAFYGTLFWELSSSSIIIIIITSSSSLNGIALDYGLYDRWFESRYRLGIFLQHRAQTGSRTHPASYPMGTRGSYPGRKPAGTLTWPLTSIKCRSQECVELHLHSPILFHGVVLS
jgi:hypothetical protein